MTIIPELNTSQLLGFLLVDSTQVFENEKLEKNWYRSASIYSGEITSLDFNLKREDKSQLIQYGKDGTKAFLERALPPRFDPQRRKTGSSVQPQTSRGVQPKIPVFRPSNNKTTFKREFPSATIGNAEAWGENNCLIDTLLQLVGFKGNRKTECQRIRARLIEIDPLIIHGDELYFSRASDILAIHLGEAEATRYHIIGHSTYENDLAYPEFCGNRNDENIELHLWNTGNHFEPIKNMPTNWEQNSKYQEFLH